MSDLKKFAIGVWKGLVIFAIALGISVGSIAMIWIGFEHPLVALGVLLLAFLVVAGFINVQGTL